MSRRARYEPLNVFLNSRLVGQLRRETSGAITFQYDRSWLEWQLALPVSLSLPLREQPYVGAPVLAVFENLLPDSDSLRRQIAARAPKEPTPIACWAQLATIVWVRYSSFPRTYNPPRRWTPDWSHC